MLTIEFVEEEEVLSMGELFAELGVDKLSPDADGETFVRNEFAIRVRSLDEFYDIEGFRMTKPERTVTLVTATGKKLTASPKHLVLARDGKTGLEAWVEMGNLVGGDAVCVLPDVGPAQWEDVGVVSPSGLDLVRLYDLQVEIAHSYFTSRILSHNSHFLTFLGANAMRQHKTVIHYTFELSETAVGLRYDSNLCDMPSNEVQDRKEEVLKHYAENKYGKLFIKHYPMHTASVNTLRSHYEKLVLMKGVRPDIVIVDYADIMRSSRRYEELRHELKLVYEELRSWADEIEVPLWTASQVNRAATESEVIGAESISEAYGKVMTADFLVSISRKRIEKAAGWGRLYVVKNRAGRDGLLYTVKMDTSKSMFAITNEESREKLSQEEESDMKAMIKAKWESIQKNNELKVKPIESESKTEDDAAQ